MGAGARGSCLQWRGARPYVADACPGVLRAARRGRRRARAGPAARRRDRRGRAAGGRGLRARTWATGGVQLTSRGQRAAAGPAPRRPAPLAARLADAGLLPSATHERVRNVARLAARPGSRAGCRTCATWLPRSTAALCARPGAGRAAGPVPVRARRRPRRRRRRRTRTCAGRRRTGVLLAGGATPGCGWPRRRRWPRSWTRRRRSSRCGRRTAGRRGGRRSWPVHPRGSAPALARTSGRRDIVQPGRRHSGRTADDRRAGRRAPGPRRPRRRRARRSSCAPLLGELTAAPGPPPRRRRAASVVITPWRTVVLPDAPGVAAARAGRRRAASSTPGRRAAASAPAPGGRAARRPSPTCGPTRSAALAAGFTERSHHVSGCERRCGRPAAAHVDAVALAGGGYLVDGVRPPGTGAVTRELRPRRRGDLPPLVRHHPRRGRPGRRCRADVAPGRRPDDPRLRAGRPGRRPRLLPRRRRRGPGGAAGGRADPLRRRDGRLRRHPRPAARRQRRASAPCATRACPTLAAAAGHHPQRRRAGAVARPARRRGRRDRQRPDRAVPPARDDRRRRAAAGRGPRHPGRLHRRGRVEGGAGRRTDLDRTWSSTAAAAAARSRRRGQRARAARRR